MILAEFSGPKQKNTSALFSAASATALSLGLLASYPMTASSDPLNDAFSRFGSTAMINDPNIAQTSSAYLFTGGSFKMRSSTNTYQLASLQLPSMSAGCGGIDLFAGAFSFLNIDGLIEMAKNIGSAALGTAFQIALSSLAPQLYEVINQLQDWANKLNQFNIDSCEAGARLAGAAAQTMGVRDKFCEMAQRGENVGDAFSARSACSQKGLNIFSSTTADPEGSNAAIIKDQLQGNLMWRALHRMYDRQWGADEFSSEFAEVIMSMTGTVIYPPVDDSKKSSITQPTTFPTGDGSRNGVGTKDDEQPEKPIPIAATMTPAQFFTYEEDLKVNLLSCDDQDNCLKPTESVGVNHPANDLYKRVEGAVKNIFESARDSNANLSADAKAVLSMTNIPIFAIAQAAYDAGQVGVAQQLEHEISRYTQYISYQIMYGMIDKGLSLVSSALAAGSQQPGGSYEDAKALRENILSVREAVFDVYSESSEQLGMDYASQMQLLKMLQQMAASRYAPSITERIAFTRKAMAGIGANPSSAQGDYN